MAPLHDFMAGMMVALQPANLFYCFIGCVAGTLVGVLPGIGPTAAVALLLPTTFHMDPISAIIMLSGIAYGSAYGGSITSILVNVPGEACSVVTCLDGYQMAKKGRAGPALGIAAFGSFIAGTLAVAGVMLLAPTLSRAALAFGSPEYFSLMLMSIMIVTYLVRGSDAQGPFDGGAGTDSRDNRHGSDQRQGPFRIRAARTQGRHRCDPHRDRDVRRHRDPRDHRISAQKGSV